MSRPLRIEFLGAWYHVMNRGRRYESIFSDKKDYQIFIDLMMEASEMWNVNIAAYCLMTNHYHLLVQTPNANISRFMRHLNGVYTQRYNRRYKLDGQLFRGRYKSIIVSNDEHLIQIVRYIHKNPVKAGRVKKMSRYSWSSYNGYLSHSDQWKWLYKNLIISMIAPEEHGRLETVKQFMQQDDSEDINRLFSSKNTPSIFGSEDFKTKIKNRYYSRKKNYEVPESKTFSPRSDLIIKTVCDQYGVSFDALLETKRGQFNEPRNMAVYLLRQIRGDRLLSIGELFGIRSYSTVSSIVRRISQLEKTQKRIQVQIKNLRKGIANAHKGQT